jgi:hypothetical protein
MHIFNETLHMMVRKMSGWECLPKRKERQKKKKKREKGKEKDTSGPVTETSKKSPPVTLLAPFLVLI